MRQAIYRNREEAGRVLARELEDRAGPETVVLAIPNGGVAVAAPVAERLKAPLYLMVVRKIQIPGNTEAGFGAVSADGTSVLDKDLIGRLGLDEAVVEFQRQRALASVKDRLKRYGEEADLPELAGKTVVLVDDGLASGATMETAVRIVKKMQARRAVVAVPTASARAFDRLSRLADELVCPHVGCGPVFAVADAYRNWYDVSDGEVLEVLSAAKKRQG